MPEPNAPRYCQNPLPISDVFERLLQEMNAQTKFKQEKLKAEWAEIVGDSIARRTTQLYFQGNKLFVRVNTASLKQELVMSKSALLSAIYTYFQEIIVEDIVIL